MDNPLIQQITLVALGFIVGYSLGLITRIESIKWVGINGKKGTKKKTK